MPVAYLEVIRVVRRSYFDCAGTEGRVDVFVCDDRNLPFCERKQYA